MMYKQSIGLPPVFMLQKSTPDCLQHKNVLSNK